MDCSLDWRTPPFSLARAACALWGDPERQESKRSIEMTANTVAGAVRMAILALALAVASAPAQAQQPSANAIAMAREILALKGSAGLYEALPPGVIERVRAIHLQTNPML